MAWPACIAALSILYANVGHGSWERRSAMAWMMGSWGARLAVQAFYTRAAAITRDDDGGGPGSLDDAALLASAAFFSFPALIASINPEPLLSTIELAGCALWVVGFALETTADRQWLRFASTPGNAGLACRAGLWRYSPNAHAILDTLVWIAFALFASGSPWGWTSFACPLARVVLSITRRGFPVAAAAPERAD